MLNYYLVTGANNGIGFAVCKELLKRNFNVIALSRNENNLQLLKNDSTNLLILKFDLQKIEKFVEIQQFLISNNAKFLGIINNAGYLINKKFKDLDYSDWLNTFQVNLFAPVLLIKELLPFFLKKSHIVNISSMGGFQGSSKFLGLSSYSASKAAIANFSECLAVELKDLEIRVNALCLGAVQTEMLNKAFPDYKAPIKPEEMALFITDFLLKSHHFLNGKIIPVNLSNP